MVAVPAWFCMAGPSLHEEPVPTTTSLNSNMCGTEVRSLETTPENQPLTKLDPNLSSKMHGTEAQSLETVPENQPLEPNLEPSSNPISSNGSPDVDMVDTTDFQPSSSPAITSSAGLGAEAIPPQPIPPQPLSLPLSLPFNNPNSAQGPSGTWHIESEESEVDDDDDDTPSKHRKKPGKWGQKNYLHDAF
ncbi:hypothetical protein PAXRUDRAFT_15710 [Paxillus rubicundulus Ve08.2h10]|uniref:Uncharacterized protein n=1 Tax=Paxillus rubicundulus Ve08.2h10 TaxID=930991 RepID=A0A0D0CCU1_9AGAM|nr:hypothetical protein PAXRUDRAFT_15710 [Paxillus rubicundulus Ve08.2h10]